MLSVSHAHSLTSLVNDPSLPVSIAPSNLVEMILSNGFSLYLDSRKDPNSLESYASIHLVVKAGLLEEEPDERGLSHLIEHCVFQGTRFYNAKEIQTAIQLLGFQVGGDSNAETHLTKTSFLFQNIPLTDLEKLKSLLTLLFELVSYATFPLDEIVKEREVVKEELLALKNNVNRDNDEQLSSLLFKDSSLAWHFPYAADLSDKIIACTAEELQQMMIKFYRKWYQPHLMGLFIVGDIKEGFQKELLDFSKNVFGEMPLPAQRSINNANNLAKTYPAPYNIPRGKEVVYSSFSHTQIIEPTITFYRRKKNSSMTPYPVTLGKKSLYDKFKALVKRQLLQIILETRFYPAYLKSQPSIDLVSFDADPFQLVKGVVYETAMLKTIPGKMQNAFKKFLKEIKRLSLHGCKEWEYITATNFLESLIKDQLKQNLSHELVAGRYAYAFEHSQPFFDEDKYLTTQLSILKQLDWSVINKKSRTFFNYFKPERYSQTTISILTPESEFTNKLISDLKNIYNHVNSLNHLKMVNDLTIDDKWLPKLLPAPSGSVQYLKTIDCHKIGLNNGIQVFIKPTLDQNPSVKFHFVWPRGKNHLTRKEQVELQIGMAAYFRSNYEDRTLLEGYHYLRKFPIRPWLTFTLHRHYGLVEGVAYSEEGVEKLLQVLYLRLAHTKTILSPSFEEACKNELAARHEAVQLSVFTESFKLKQSYHNLMLQHLAPLSYEIQPDEIQGFSVKDCQNTIQNYLANLQQCYVVLAGKLKTDHVLSSIDSYLGNLEVKNLSYFNKSIRENGQIKTGYIDEVYYIEGLTEARSEILMAYHIPLTIHDLSSVNVNKIFSPARTMLVMNIASSLLNHFLNEILRFKNQELYSLNCSLRVSDLFVNSCLIEINFSSRSDHEIKIRSHIDEILSNLTKAQPEEFPILFNITKESYIKYFKQKIYSTDYWVNLLSATLLNQKEIEELHKQPKWIENINIDEVYQILKVMISRIEDRRTLIWNPKK